MLEYILSPATLLLASVGVVLLACIVVIRGSKVLFIKGLEGRVGALSEHLDRQRALLSDLGELEAKSKSLEAALVEGSQKLEMIQEDLKTLEPRHLELEGKYETTKAQYLELESKRKDLAEYIEVYEERVKRLDELEGSVKATKEELLQLEEQLAELPEKRKELLQIHEDIDKARQQQIEIEKASQALKEKATEEIKGLEKSLQERKTALAEVEEAIASADDVAAKQKAELDAVLQSKQKEIAEMEGRISEMAKVAEDAEKELRQLQKDLNQREKDIVEIDSEISAKKSIQKTIGRISPEAFESLYHPWVGERSGACEMTDERDLLARVGDTLSEAGYEIPDRLQLAFHTALKTSDISCLTVMAGVSGTGKSAFPKIYAEAVGMHFLPLSVEPRWDSPQDLFGFLNYMENRFEATTLGRALVQFDNSEYSATHIKVPGLTEPPMLDDQLLLVMLDEMNLARIEYYFSEFLSKLEMRRNVDIRNEKDYRMVSSEVYGGSLDEEGNQLCPSIRLFAGSNVLFVGTMNEDESTQSLSDKVIDRANVIHFGRPDQMTVQKQKVASVDFEPIAVDTWDSWIQKRPETIIPDYAQVEGRVNNINGILAGLGRPFGWRTFKAIMAYIANHPDVSLNEKDPMQAFADQVAMRVMPKLRGLDLREHAETFTQLETELNMLNDRALSDAFNDGKDNTMGFFNWRGIRW